MTCNTTHNESQVEASIRNVLLFVHFLENFTVLATTPLVCILVTDLLGLMVSTSEPSNLLKIISYTAK